ncbi:MAG: glycosyltransferase [Candidatus Latescibacteria bacterium]|nr:glycosyltransferase [Candidatus Latescibacterota bacterium]
MTKFSVIIPLYNCEPFISELTERIRKNLSEISDNFEIIYVNDSSPGDDWNLVEGESKKDERIKGINLSRNFGQHYAISAGLQHAKGEWVYVMDGDLQDLPEEMVKLYNNTEGDYKIVLAQRKIRKDNLLKRASSRLFYRLFSYLTDIRLDSSVANFGIYHEKVIEYFLKMQDQVRYFPTMIQWVGFKKKYVPVEHGERAEGRSSYSYRSLFKLAFNNIIAFSSKPLRLTITLGMVISLTSFITGVYYLINYLLGNITQMGFTSLILSIWFLGGIVIMILGMLGVYIGKIFDKVKNRPMYIIENTINIE